MADAIGCPYFPAGSQCVDLFTYSECVTDAELDRSRQIEAPRHENSESVRRRSLVRCAEQRPRVEDLTDAPGTKVGARITFGQSDFVG